MGNILFLSMLFFVTLPTYSTYDVDKNKPPHQWPRFLLVSKPMRTGQDRNQYQASAVPQRSCQAAGGLWRQSTYCGLRTGQRPFFTAQLTCPGVSTQKICLKSKTKLNTTGC